MGVNCYAMAYVVMTYSCCHGIDVSMKWRLIQFQAVKWEERENEEIAKAHLFLIKSKEQESYLSTRKRNEVWQIKKPPFFPQLLPQNNPWVMKLKV